ADYQKLSDLPVGQPADEQRGNLALSRGQAVVKSLRPRGRHAMGLGAHRHSVIEGLLGGERASLVPSDTRGFPAEPLAGAGHLLCQPTLKTIGGTAVLLSQG